MLFDAGNLITLGIVFLFLILFRLLDRGNRSLDKVRKYSERCKEDINAFIQEKAAVIRDYGINLEVERKSAIELMRRIQTLTREELAQKVEALSQIDDRIRDYDASLEELVQMTGRVQENLNRIRDESAFVEGVGKRIGDVKEKIETLGKDITTTSKKLETIEQAFELENTQALERAMDVVVSAARSTVADFEANAQTIERKIEDHRESVEKLERIREDKLARDEEKIEKLLTEAVEKAGSRADKIEEAALVKLREQAQDRVNIIKSNFEEKIKAVQESVKVKLGEIQEQLKANREEWKTETSAIETRQKTYTSEWKRDVQELHSLAKHQKDSWNNEIVEFAFAIKQQTDDTKVTIQKQIDDLDEAIKKQQEDWKTMSHNTGQEIIAAAQETVRARIDVIEFQLKDNGDKWNAETAAIEARQNAYIAGWKEDIQELSSFAKQQKDEWNKEITEFAALAKAQAVNLDESIKKQREDWEALSRDTGQEIISAAHDRLEGYRLAQEEQFRQLSGVAGDAARLEEELRRSMQDATNRVNTDFDRFGAEFNGQLQALRDELAGLDQSLAGIKENAAENVSKNLKIFEDEFLADLDKRDGEIDQQLAAWQETLDKRLELIAGDSEAKRQKTEAQITEDVKKTLAAQGEKLVSELERLKTETAAFEEGIREEMRGVDESRKSFSEQLDRDLEEVKIAAEDDLKTKIGQYTLSVSDTLRLSQRELESQIRDLAQDSKDRIADMEASSENFRKAIEEWQGQCSARMRELDTSMEDTRRKGREFSAENEERITTARASLDELRKEIAAQTKLFDRTDTLKAELDRHVQDMSGNIDRLLQLKNEIAHFENQFIQIKRLEDDVNAKMTRFLSEKRRIEVMENDFNRLLQTSQSVEEKLAQVSNSDDALQTIQLQIRRIEDAIRETEEKYQRVERKNKTLQETNDGIDRNFKALQEDEQTIKRLEDTIGTLKVNMDSIEGSVESLSEKNEIAREAAEKLATLDENVKWLEKRIGEMNVAREGLARLATELTSLDKDAQTQLKLTRSLLDRETVKPAKTGDEGAPPPRDRENVIRLKRSGWSIDEIARSMKISKGEVELILELSPKDT